jgi:hypothetical protein
MEDRFVPATTTLRVRAPLQAQVGQGAGTAVLTLNLVAGENITRPPLPAPAAAARP